MAVDPIALRRQGFTDAQIAAMDRGVGQNASGALSNYLSAAGNALRAAGYGAQSEIGGVADTALGAAGIRTNLAAAPTASATTFATRAMRDIDLGNAMGRQALATTLGGQVSPAGVRPLVPTTAAPRSVAPPAPSTAAPSAQAAPAGPRYIVTNQVNRINPQPQENGALRLSIPSGFTGGAVPTAPSYVATNPVADQFQRQQQLLNEQLSRSLGVIGAGTAREGYRMGDITRAYMQAGLAQQGLNSLNASLASFRGTDVGADVARANQQGQNQALLAREGLQNQGALAVAGLTGEYGLRREQLQGNVALARENAILASKASSGDAAKSLAEAQNVQLKNAALTALLQGQRLSPQALGVLGYNSPATEVTLNPNAIQNKDGTWNTPPGYVRTPGGDLLTLEQYQKAQELGKL